MFEFDDNKVYRMPPFFGGDDFDPNTKANVNDVVTINFIQTTCGSWLADYLPEGFELLRPELIISFCQLREVEFMAGSSYNLIQVGVPARFNGIYDQLEGTFPLVIWENKVRPIIGGREESGQPKIYADIEDLHIYKEKYFTNASYEGNTFLRLKMVKPQVVSNDELEQIQASMENYNVFGWRYIPKVGAPGADLSQPILYPQSAQIENAWVGEGTVKWIKLNWELNEYQYRILKALSQLPVKGATNVMMTKGSITMKPFAGHVLK
ncbi:acetoacetate decarboxylase family protein [Haloimpatiens sp. FM7330]|uniref:acetoacetate decarboxylase family protein n=1 Tax=Haloimpatiens sp. FM7330 TaxID=3298610 RepID=UPI0036458D15